MALAQERARPSSCEDYLRSAAGATELALEGVLTAGFSVCRVALAACFLGLLDDLFGFMGFFAP